MKSSATSSPRQCSSCRAEGGRRRRWLGAALLAALVSWAGVAQADTYPSRPIRLVVAFGTGSVNDIVARDLAQQMSATLGQPVIVENRTGGGGTVGTQAVAKAAPDGYTIGLGTSSQLVMNVALFESLPFDVERDLQSIGLVSRTGMVLAASAQMPATLGELIAQARGKPGKLSFGSGGAGSISHIVGESFAKAAGVSLLHVPYKGNGAAMIDLSGGHVDLLFDSLLSAAPLAAQGRVRLLAVGGAKRSALAPDTPTFAEAGLPGFDGYTWNSLMVPAGTPAPVIAALNAALNAALASPAVQERLGRAGSVSLGPSTPQQAHEFARAERARWVPFVRSLGIKPE